MVPSRMAVSRLASDYTFGKASLAQCLHAEKDRPMKVWLNSTGVSAPEALIVD